MARPKGSYGKESPAGYKRAAFWAAARFYRLFTCADLAMAANSNYAAAFTFISALTRAGVFRKETVPGSRQPKYALVRDLGPKSPLVRRVFAVFDPNSGAVLPDGGGRGGK
jgi:hypothetical protein